MALHQSQPVSEAHFRFTFKCIFQISFSHFDSLGNWGCGSTSKGDVQTKLVIQWMAASLAGLPVLLYYTSGHEKLAKVHKYQLELRFIQNSKLEISIDFIFDSWTQCAVFYWIANGQLVNWQLRRLTMPKIY